ncbi:MAG TPA: hypothetical protein DDX91_05660 [Ruminococcaceae bacterium]|nr:hypothetical protein [Oscillospiraceae bacterium]
MNDKKTENKNNVVNRGNDSSQFPDKTKEPQYLTYIVTDNITTENGCVRNKDDIDARICRNEVDANKK